jgi:hypothetical protein
VELRARPSSWDSVPGLGREGEKERDRLEPLRPELRHLRLACGRLGRRRREASSDEPEGECPGLARPWLPPGRPPCHRLSQPELPLLSGEGEEDSEELRSPPGRSPSSRPPCGHGLQHGLQINLNAYYQINKYT